MFIVEDNIPAPEFTVTHWVNTSPLTMAGLRGKVVLVDFWDYTCINCLRTLPYLKAWYERYWDKGLVIVGVHAPEFPFGRELENVSWAVETFSIRYPVAMDNDFATWKAFTNRYWPAKYLIDQDGTVRYFHFGEGEYLGTEYLIQELLHEVDSNMVMPDLMAPLRESDVQGAICYRPTPELYLGLVRGTIGNPEGARPDEVTTYAPPQQMAMDRIYLEGPWCCGDAFVESVGEEPHAIHLIYRGAEMNLVLSPVGETPVRVIIEQDDAALLPENRGEDVEVDESGQTVVVVDRPRMYRLTCNQDNVIYRLCLRVNQPGLQVFAFTFVGCLVRPDAGT